MDTVKKSEGGEVSEPKRPSERSFGFLFAIIFLGMAVYGLYRGWSQEFSVAWFVASIILGTIALLAPQKLAPFNTAWFLFGQLLGKVVNPIVLGFIFFGLITPIAVVTRLLGRDVLHLKHGSSVSYWVDRVPPASAVDSFKNQF